MILAIIQTKIPEATPYMNVDTTENIAAKTVMCLKPYLLKSQANHWLEAKRINRLMDRRNPIQTTGTFNCAALAAKAAYKKLSPNN